MTDRRLFDIARYARRRPLPLGPALALGVALAFLGLISSVEAVDSISVPDGPADVGMFSSLALDADGNPVVSYYDFTNGNLKILHCNDPLCEGGDESIETPDATDDVGQYTSLALDADGHPVVSYYDSTNGDLKILHCNDPLCEGGDESIETPDTAGNVGRNTSLELDADGNPVVSYHDFTNGNLKVLHCNDPLCEGDDESIETPDTAGGSNTSLALDADGNPVVSYYGAAADLKVLHCNDPYCAGGDDSIESPDTVDNTGLDSSLVLDADGNPVISYHHGQNTSLNVLHCDDPNCAGADESDNITTPDTNGLVGQDSSLALDADGNPVISYHVSTPSFDLRILHCDDPHCAGDESSNITSPDTAGRVGHHTSLALDANGNPVVSYHASLDNFDLKILHCDDPNCLATGTIEVRKQVINGNGTFDLLLDGVVQLSDATGGSTTGPISTTGGDHTIAEQGDNLDNYIGRVVCSNQDGDQEESAWQQNPAAEFPLTVADGDEWLCVFTNVLIPEECLGIGLTNVVLGTGGRDILRGTGENDLILGFGGDDYLYASGGGTDCVVGGEGDDRLRGDSVDELIEGNGQGVTSTPDGTNNEIGDDDDDGDDDYTSGQNDSIGDNDNNVPNNDDDDDRPRRPSRR